MTKSNFRLLKNKIVNTAIMKGWRNDVAPGDMLIITCPEFVGELSNKLKVVVLDVNMFYTVPAIGRKFKFKNNHEQEMHSTFDYQLMAKLNLDSLDDLHNSFSVLEHFRVVSLKVSAYQRVNNAAKLFQ